MEEVIEEFGTGFLRTRVLRGDQGYLWERRPGPERRAALGEPGPALRSAAQGVLAQASVVVAESVGQARRYPVPGRSTAAKVILSASASAHHARLCHALHGTGQALRALHAGFDPQLASSGPPGPDRLSAWMQRGTGPGAARRFHDVLLRRLGPVLWQRAQVWCQAMAEDRSANVFLHGAPSLGVIIVGDREEDWRLLFGEEYACGPAGFDIGWLLGEFTELGMLIDRGTPGAMDPARYEDIREALITGYGPIADPADAARAAALRVITHAHDFASYVGWHPQLELYVEKIADLLDGEDIGAASATSCAAGRPRA